MFTHTTRDTMCIYIVGDEWWCLDNEMKTAEAERIRKCRGRVFALKEESHIERVWLPYDDSPGLAMSRAFGDFVLKNNGIICIPEVSHHRITPNDAFLVVASDGVSKNSRKKPLKPNIFQFIRFSGSFF